MSSAPTDVAALSSAPLLAYRRRIRMVDTDAAKLIYFAAVYPWAEVLFTDWLADLGHPLSSILETGIGLPTVRSEAQYLHPLGLDDELELQLRANHVGQHSFSLLVTMYRLPEMLECVRVRIWHAYVEMEAVEGSRTPKVKPAELPAWIREGLRPDPSPREVT